MLRHYTIPALLACVPLTIGCGDLNVSAEENVASSSEAIVVDNGGSLNGTSLNGTSLNGTSLNGTSLNGTSLNGTSLNGTSLNGTGLNGMSLKGVAFIGAQMSGLLQTGASVNLRIDSILPSIDPEILLYTVSYQSGGSWKSICGVDKSGKSIQAIPLSGRWDGSEGTPTGGAWISDPGKITFACVGSALAKCTQLGYKPWKMVKECNDSDCPTIPVRTFHQACTRMIRADYCGDGKPHTVDGVPINLWDDFGFQQKQILGTTSYKNGSEWSAEGSACVMQYRYDPGGATSSYVSSHCPQNMKGDYKCFGNDSPFFARDDVDDDDDDDDDDGGWSGSVNERGLLRDTFDAKFVQSSVP